MYFHIENKETKRGTCDTFWKFAISWGFKVQWICIAELSSLDIEEKTCKYSSWLKSSRSNQQFNWPIKCSWLNIFMMGIPWIYVSCNIYEICDPDYDTKLHIFWYFTLGGKIIGHVEMKICYRLPSRSLRKEVWLN